MFPPQKLARNVLLGLYRPSLNCSRLRSVDLLCMQTKKHRLSLHVEKLCGRVSAACKSSILSLTLTWVTLKRTIMPFFQCQCQCRNICA